MHIDATGGPPRAFTPSPLSHSGDRDAAAMRARLADLERLRDEAEQEALRLIAELDVLDGDDDLEETGDLEPWLGVTGRECGGPVRWCDDAEVSLASTDQQDAQRAMVVDGNPNMDEREHDRCDWEPSLAAAESYYATTQVHWGRGGITDVELDDAEHGVADQDALADPTLSFRRLFDVQGVDFNGSGYDVGRQMLRGLRVGGAR